MCIKISLDRTLHASYRRMIVPLFIQALNLLHLICCMSISSRPHKCKTANDLHRSNTFHICRQKVWLREKYGQPVHNSRLHRCEHYMEGIRLAS